MNQSSGRLNCLTPLQLPGKTLLLGVGDGAAAYCREASAILGGLYYNYSYGKFGKNCSTLSHFHPQQLSGIASLGGWGFPQHQP